MKLQDSSRINQSVRLENCDEVKQWHATGRERARRELLNHFAVRNH